MKHKERTQGERDAETLDEDKVVVKEQEAAALTKLRPVSLHNEAETLSQI